MRSLRFLSRLTLGILLGSLLFTHAGYAQESNSKAIEMRMKAFTGDVVELFGMLPGPEAQFDWILTQNGDFVEAGRENIFRTRFTQPGNYVLDGQLHSDAGNPRLHVQIAVEERDIDVEPNPAPEGIGLAIVNTDLPAGPSGVRIPSETPLLTLTPSVAVTGPVSLDLDTRQDTDGDGDPINDNDAADTLFSTEHNPLHIWYAIPGIAGPLHLSTTAEDGTLLEQDIAIEAGTIAVPEGTVNVGEEQYGTVRFRLGADTLVDPTSTVFVWDFGDGRQSMVDEPKHTYLNNGQYTVRVIAREMETGRVLAQGIIDISINSIPAVVESSSSSSSSSVAAAPTPSQSSGGGSMIGTLIRIMLLLAFAIGIGAGGVWLFKKFQRNEGRLQKALEQAEGKLLKKESVEAGTTDDAPTTMKLKRPEPPAEPPVVDAPPSPPQLSPPAPPAPEPKEDTPAWLQKGLDAAKDQPSDMPPVASVDAGPGSTPATPPVPVPLADRSLGEGRVPTPAPSPEPPPLPSAIDETPSSSPTPAPPSSPPAPSAPAQAPSEPSAATSAMTEDDMLPPWLRNEDAKTADVSEGTEGTDATEVKSPEVTAAVPVPDVAETPAPVAPEPVPDVPVINTPEPADATPVVEKPAPPVPSPVPEPVAPPMPEPPAPAAPTPAPAPATVTSADQERLERERERKKRKRQRYRENLKKRSAADAQVPAAAAPPVAPSKAPVIPQRKPVPPKPPVPKPEPQDIPPANPSAGLRPAVKEAPSNDDKVAFVIKAEGIEKKKKETKKKEHEANGQL